ncbi:hypothetical protein THIOKS12790012 [Thiocapsa sp. KS1]|nr:hypothetical protein THIOKS12790012 [Thiocapsa sp. KS1]
MNPSVVGEPTRRLLDESARRRGSTKIIETLEPRLRLRTLARPRPNHATTAQIPQDAARYGSKQLDQRSHRADLREHERNQPQQERVATALDGSRHLAAQLLDLRLDLAAQLLDLGFDLAAQLLDPDGEIRAQLLDLSRQSQLGLAQMALRHQLGQVRIAFLQTFERLGDDPRPRPFVRRAGQGFVQLDNRAHGRLPSVDR